MSGLGKKLNEKARSLISKYYDPKDAGNKAGIEFLNRGGFLFWRLDQMGLLKKESLTEQDADYSRVTLPWLDVGKNSDHFGRFDAFKDLFNYYEGLERIINVERYSKLKEINEKIIEDNVRIRGENLERERKGLSPLSEKDYATIQDLKHVPLDPELEEYREYLRSLLQWGSSILLGISYENPDDNKTLVVSKPIIMDASKTRIIEKGGGMEDQPEDGER